MVFIDSECNIDCKYITPRISTDTNNLNNKLPYSTKEALRIQQPFSSSVSQTTPLPQGYMCFITNNCRCFGV